MESKSTKSPKSLNNRQNKDKLLILNYIRIQIEKGIGLTISQFRNENSEEHLYYTALKFVTTTNRTICEALNIAISDGTRHKRELEKSNLLVQSIDEFYCPFTEHKAHLLSTNPNEFEKLNKSKFLQLTLF